LPSVPIIRGTGTLDNSEAHKDWGGILPNSVVR
jgi:hypothetical protein